MEPLEDILIDGGADGQVLAKSPTLPEELNNEPQLLDSPNPSPATRVNPKTPNREIPSYIDKIPDNIEEWE